MKFVCMYCKRFKDDESGDQTETHGTCAKCMFAWCKKEDIFDDPMTIKKLESAVIAKPEKDLSGDFNYYFPEECYSGFEEFAEKVFREKEQSGESLRGKKL